MAVLNTVVTEEQTVVDNDAAKHYTHTQMYTYAFGLTCAQTGDEGQGQAAASPEISEPISALVLQTWAAGASAGQSFYEHHPAFRSSGQTC